MNLAGLRLERHLFKHAVAGNQTMKRFSLSMAAAFSVFTGASPAFAQDITNRMSGATVVYSVGTRFSETYQKDGTWVRIATEQNGTRSRFTGKWMLVTIRGKRNLCWKMDGTGLEKCAWYIRKGNSYYEADRSAEFRLDSITFSR